MLETDDHSETGGREFEFKIVNWIAIINQLSTALAQTELNELNLPMSEFMMLNHFVHRPDEGKTISDIARHRQLQQPGVSKTIRKMLDRGWLRSVDNPEDARSIVLFLTKDGQAIYQKGLELLYPVLERTFSDFDEADKRQLFQQLERLKIWFDTHRRDV